MPSRSSLEAGTALQTRTPNRPLLDELDRLVEEEEPEEIQVRTEDPDTEDTDNDDDPQDETPNQFRGFEVSDLLKMSFTPIRERPMDYAD